MAEGTSPTARALMALELIQDRPGITAGQLAAGLGVTERAARRYAGILREAGLPVESSRGPFGGYRFGRGLRLPPLIFSAAEALGLVMAVLDGHHDARDSSSIVGAALGKIMRALPAPVAAQAESVRRTAAAAPDRNAARPDPLVTTTLVQACSEHRQVRIDYRSEAGSQWSSDVEPWAIVIRHGRWYLLCHSRAAGAPRAYRVDRVLTARLLDAAFLPPTDLDPVATLEEHLAVGWEYRAEVIIDAPADDVRGYVRGLGQLGPDGPDRSRLTGTTGNPQWYAQRLAGLPVPFRVVGSPEVRDALHSLGTRLVAAAEN